MEGLAEISSQQAQIIAFIDADAACFRGSHVYVNVKKKPLFLTSSCFIISRMAIFPPTRVIYKTRWFHFRQMDSVKLLAFHLFFHLVFLQLFSQLYRPHPLNLLVIAFGCDWRRSIAVLRAHQLRERGETRGTSEKQNGDHNQRGGSTHRNMHKRDVHGRSPPRSGWPKPKSATPSTLGNNERDTGATEGTPEGTYTDEGKERSRRRECEMRKHKQSGWRT